MRNSKRISVLAGGTAALIGVGVAFAAWTSTGTDTTTITAGSEQGLNVVSTETLGDLFPTGSQTVDVSVTNANPYGVNLDNVALDVTITPVQDDETSPACSEDDLTGLGDLGDLGYLAAGGEWTGTVEVGMIADAVENCQFDDFVIDFNATGHSVAAPQQ